MENIKLQGQELYDLIATTQIDPKLEYYRLIVKYKDAILYDSMLIGQAKVAEHLNISQSKLSPIVNILKAL